MMAVVFGAQGAGQFFSFAPDATKAMSATINVTRLLEHEPEIDVWSKDGKSVEQLESGHIEFKNVHFSYPTRYIYKFCPYNCSPDVHVLKGLNLDIKPGQYVALVGQSGCGKSTTVSLIERFYDPVAGEVLVDGLPISAYNLSEYRRNISIVSQEPTYVQLRVSLTAASIKEQFDLISSSVQTGM
jgi:ATP-binding cassette, subfamily B (MDR/TAP), member 1